MDPGGRRRTTDAALQGVGDPSRRGVCGDESSLDPVECPLSGRCSRGLRAGARAGNRCGRRAECSAPVRDDRVYAEQRRRAVRHHGAIDLVPRRPQEAHRGAGCAVAPARVALPTHAPVRDRLRSLCVPLQDPRPRPAGRACHRLHDGELERTYPRRHSRTPAQAGSSRTPHRQQHLTFIRRPQLPRGRWGVMCGAGALRSQRVDRIRCAAQRQRRPVHRASRRARTIMAMSSGSSRSRPVSSRARRRR